jgi:rhodanese-related sulfurtransferase
MKTILFALSMAIGLVACKNNTTANSNTTNSTNTATATTPTKVVSAKDFVDMIVKMDKKDYYIIDVRTKAEADGGMLVDAINIDFQSPNFEEELAKLDKSKTAFVYCQGGVRSAKACKIAEKLAFKAIFDMDGGYNAWMKL